MDLQTHGYIVGIVGIFYGTVGYALVSTELDS